MNWQGVITDVAVLTAVTLLAALHIIQPEVAIAVLGTMAGARAGARGATADAGAGGKDPPKLPPGGTLGLLLVGGAILCHSLLRKVT